MNWVKNSSVDDYVIDMHCSRGRMSGKNTIDFKNEGSLVVNENQKWFVKKYRDKYKNRRLIKNFYTLHSLIIILKIFSICSCLKIFSFEILND